MKLGQNQMFVCVLLKNAFEIYWDLLTFSWAIWKKSKGCVKLGEFVLHITIGLLWVIKVRKYEKQYFLQKVMISFLIFALDFKIGQI